MLKVGDLIIYAAHGLSRVEDICEKTFLGQTKTYYVIRPVDDSKLTIQVPIDNDSVVMLQMVGKAGAEKILSSFKYPGIDWIEKNNERIHKYSKLVNTGDRNDIAKIVNTLMRRKLEVETSGKKLGEVDNRLLTSTQKILFTDMAVSMDTSFEDIMEKVTDLISQPMKEVINI